MTPPPYYLRCLECGGRAFYLTEPPARGAADRRVAVLTADGVHVVDEPSVRPACQDCGKRLTLENLSVIRVRQTAP